MYELLILNSSGSIVLSGKINSGDIHRIDVSRLPSGLFMIILSNEAYQYSGKIIIIR
jgi:hypothetical protein